MPLNIFINKVSINNMLTDMLKELSSQQYQFETNTIDEQLLEIILFVKSVPLLILSLFAMPLEYLFSIPSECKLVKEIQVNMAYRYCLRMEIMEKVLDTSKFSQNRICRFNDSDIYQQIFDRVVEQAMSGGMAKE